jgi:hypothetical protein
MGRRRRSLQRLVTIIASYRVLHEHWGGVRVKLMLWVNAQTTLEKAVRVVLVGEGDDGTFGHVAFMG